MRLKQFRLLFVIYNCEINFFFINPRWCLTWGKHQQQFSSCLHTQAVAPAPDPVAAHRDAGQTPAEAALFPGHAALFHFHPPPPPPPPRTRGTPATSSYEGCNEMDHWRTYGNPNGLLINSFVGMITNMHFFVGALRQCFLHYNCFVSPDLCWPQFRWEHRDRTCASKIRSWTITVNTQQ